MLGFHLDCLMVLNLPALWPLGYVEPHRLPLLQAAKAACLNSGDNARRHPHQFDG